MVNSLQLKIYQMTKSKYFNGIHPALYLAFPLCMFFGADPVIAFSVYMVTAITSKVCIYYLSNKYSNSEPAEKPSVEIERKYLVTPEFDISKLKVRSTTDIVQGYLISSKESTIRLRIAGDKSFITIKGPTVGITRSEYEYEIPVKDAREMLVGHEDKTIIKTRMVVGYKDFDWEVDFFKGRHEGLVLAEVEIDHEDCTPPLLPGLGKEVSTDSKYFNAVLVKTDWRP